MFVKLTTSRLPIQHTDGLAQYPVLSRSPPSYRRAAGAEVDARLRQLIRGIARAEYAAPGIGLAATQVNVHQRVMVIDVSDTRDQLQAFINPELTETSAQTKPGEE